ncbi:hypothetical protein BH23GEM7_BH23GEM7_07410 [soil metagenome]
MHERGEVLVAILRDARDLPIARDQHWYRIPVASARKWLKERWPPEWVAFYQPRVFGDDAYSIRYYAGVLDVKKRLRSELFPAEFQTDKREREYYQLILGPLKELPRPIFSRRWRRIVFISTTWAKLFAASEINDLFDGSPLEDRLWAEFKRYAIPAERQEFVVIGMQQYALDFAIYCADGRVDVETDGDLWHANPERAAEDNLRDNALESSGWKVLRFTRRQVNEAVAAYCIPTVAATINSLGGLDEGGILPRNIIVEPGGQYGFFDAPGGQG